MMIKINYSHYNPVTERVKSDVATFSPVNQFADPSNKYFPVTQKVSGPAELSGKSIF